MKHESRAQSRGVGRPNGMPDYDFAIWELIKAGFWVWVGWKLRGWI